MRIVRQLPGALLGLIMLVSILPGVVLLGAGPASAHDAVESTSPAAGATVPTPPATVALTLSNPPLTLGTRIKVSDAAGTDWAVGGVQIVDNVVSQKLRTGAPAGLFTVQWRVVSADGHPIDGTFSFTAAAGGDSAAAGTAPAAGTVPTLGTAEPGTTIAPSPVPDASQPFPWSIVLFVAVAVGILVALGLMAKRRLNDGQDVSADGDGDGQDGSVDGGGGTGAGQSGSPRQPGSGS